MVTICEIAINLMFDTVIISVMVKKYPYLMVNVDHFVNFSLKCFYPPLTVDGKRNPSFCWLMVKILAI